MYFSSVGKYLFVLFFALLTWSRGTSIHEYTAAAPVSSRTEIVYVRCQLFELAVPLRAMTVSPGPSTAAAPVTLNWARSTVTDHVTAADRPPEYQVGGAIYTRQRLLQLRDLTVERRNKPSDDFLARLRRLGIARGVGHRGVRGGRKSRRPIPVHVTSRPFTVRTGRTDGQRYLLHPPRLTLRQTEAAMVAAPTGSTHPTVSAASSNITIELLNVQSLLPKLPDIEAELQQRDADIYCFTETNLKTGTPNRLVSLPGYRLYRQDRTLGRKKAGGGVAVYLGDTLQAARIATPAPSGQSHAESLWLSVKLNKKRATTIGCIYRPPSTSATQVDADYDHIEEQLQAVLAAHPSQKIAVTGDLNSDARTSPAAHHSLLELEERFGLCNVVCQPTFSEVTYSPSWMWCYYHVTCDFNNPPACFIETCQNASEVPILDVLRHAAAEARFSDRFSKNPNVDIDVIMKTTRASDVTSDKVVGYVQANSIEPFKVHIFTEELLRHFNTNTSPLHIDATGSVVRKINGKDVYCYAVVASDDEGSYPLGLMLSNSQTTVSITHFLQHLNDSYKTIIRKDMRPTAVVTDFSWALIKAGLLAFNKMGITQYLETYWRAIIKAEDPDMITFTMCRAHISKGLSCMLKSHIADKKVRHSYMWLFSKMAEAETLETMEEVFQEICTLAYSPSVDNKKMEELLSEDHEEDEEVDKEDVSVKKKKKLRDSTPFGQHFAKIAAKAAKL